jgi:hypothetical protein
MTLFERVVAEGRLERRWAWTLPTGNPIWRGYWCEGVGSSPITRARRNFEEGPRRPAYGAECGLIAAVKGAR